MENNTKLTKWNSEPTIEDLKHDFRGAEENQRKMLTHINKWRDLKDVTGIYKPKTVKGNSSVQPKLIRKQAEWRYPSLSEPFLDIPKIFKVKPTSFEDPDKARQNESLLNYQFNHKIKKVRFINEYVRKNVDEGICIVKTFWERKTKKVKKEVPIFKYIALETEEEINQLMEMVNLSKTNYNSFLDLSEEEQESVNYFLENEQPALAVIVGSEEVEEEEIIKNQPKLEIIKVDNFYCDPTCGSNYEDSQFNVISIETSYSELKKDKRYTNLELIDFTGSTITDTYHTADTPDTFNFKDKSRKKIVLYEYWGFWDINDDGTLVPILASWIDNTIVRMELSPYPVEDKLPFVVSCYSPISNSIYGESDAELLEDNQLILGALTRANIDLVAKSANSQQGFAKNFLDVVQKKRFMSGQDYEFNPNALPQNAIHEHKSPEVSQSSIVMMNQQSQEAESITGVSMFNQGINGKQFGTLAAQVKGTLASTDERKSAYLRRLVEGIIDIGKNVIELNYAFLSEEEVIRVTNSEFVKIRREDIGGHFDIETHIYLPEASEKKASNLGFLLQTLGPNSKPELVNKMLAHIAYLQNMPEFEHDIKNINTEPTEQEIKLQELEMKKIELEIAKIESEIAVNHSKARDLTADADKTNLETESMLSGETYQREIDKQKAQAKGNQDLEITKTVLKGETPFSNVEAAIGLKSVQDSM